MHADDSVINGLWASRINAMAEAAIMRADGDRAGEDAALQRTVDLAGQIASAPTATLADAIVKLRLALQEARVVEDHDLPPAWLLVEDTLKRLTAQE